MRRGSLALAGLLVVLLLALASPAYAAPPPGASKNVEFLRNLPEVKNATAINFLQPSKRQRWFLARAARQFRADPGTAGICLIEV